MSPTQCGGLAGGLCPILGYLGSRLPPHRSPSPPAGSQHWAVPHRQFGGAAPPHAPPGFCCPSLRLLPPPGLRPPGKPPPGPAPSPAPSPDWLSCGHAPRWPRPHCPTRFPPGSAPNLHWLHPHVTAIQSVLLPPSLAPPPFSSVKNRNPIGPRRANQSTPLELANREGGSIARGLGGGSALCSRGGRGLV